jgi:hypothetical protein
MSDGFAGGSEGGAAGAGDGAADGAAGAGAGVLAAGPDGAGAGSFAIYLTSLSRRYAPTRSPPPMARSSIWKRTRSPLESVSFTLRS